MRKKIKYIFVFSIIVLASFLYGHIDKKNEIYDKTIDASLYGNMGELVDGLCVQQKFICAENVMDGVSIKTLTFGNVLNAKYHYEILDANTSEVLREGSFDSGDVPNGKYYTIRFEQIEQCKNREFIFRLESEGAKTGNALSIYNVPKGRENAELNLNTDEFSNNTLAMRTISHMFDMETFITVTCCLIYLIGFMGILIKFFH